MTHKYIDDYMTSIESGKVVAGKRIKKAMQYVKRILDDPNIYVDDKKTERAKEIIEKWFDMTLFPWQLFILACVHTYYKDTGNIVFKKFFIEMGRGNGKNGFISGLTFYLTSGAHGVRNYNVDIVANSEEQAFVSFNDIYDMLDGNWSHMKKGYSKTKLKILSKGTNSYVKANTSNSSTKDGKRSGCLIFDEVHEYETYDLIKVFTSGFGKVKHSREFYITTNGYVRGGVLDDELKLVDVILAGEGDDLRTLPLVYEIDEESDANDERNWEKANPSYPYLPNLQDEMKLHWAKAKYMPSQAIEFYTKRLNHPKQDNMALVASWDKILKTNQPIPYKKLEGADCIGGLDYAEVRDFCSCGILFRLDGKYYWHEHTFVNQQALKIESRRIKFPVEEMVERGLITIIHDASIRADTIADWFEEQVNKYNLKTVVMDSYRAKYLQDEFTERGIPFETIRKGPITHNQLHPIIESGFAEEKFIFGDNPTMRWYTNNVYLEKDKKGNVTYLKQEPQTRKTDGFFAFLHALSQYDQLDDAAPGTLPLPGVFNF
ncbi:terminase TerL endonuclease subunit [Aedoeadaptatus coxii]|uniref:terminase TerL endonuclease subunit n=1 Tax=Aedoeadaptatus coxii TaxID=755172 RepID=UPI002AD2BCFA|nr:terminase TerL endonuclease subunit [Peptoniphilus coxii]